MSVHVAYKGEDPLYIPPFLQRKDDSPVQKMSVYIVNGDALYERMFTNRGWKIVDNLDDADLVQFTGGADVSPILYGEHEHHRTFSQMHRDLVEKRIFYMALRYRKPMAGICRGGQFLNVMSGGRMYQDVDKHTCPHKAFFFDGEAVVEVPVTSTHHQMMRPQYDDPNMIVLGVAKESTVKANCSLMGELKYVKTKLHDTMPDIEALYYLETNCLCFQPHPEHHNNDGLADFYMKLVETYLISAVGEEDVRTCRRVWEDWTRRKEGLH